MDELFRDTIHKYRIEDLIREVNSRITGSNVGEETIRKDIAVIRNDWHMPLKSYSRPVYYRYEDVTMPCKQLYKFSDDEQSLLSCAIDMLSRYDAPQYQWARTFLQMVKHTNGGVGQDSCVEFQNNQELVGLKWFNPLLQACLNATQLSIRYQPYGKKETIYKVSPYWLKQYNNRWFLICKDGRYDECTHLALDRITDITADSTTRFQKFMGNKESYFRDVIGVTKHKDATKERVVLHVNPNRIKYIETKPFTDFQSSPTELPDGRYEISFRTEMNIQEPHKNRELIQTLLSFGSDIEVMEPVALREEMAKQIAVLARMYKNL